MVRLGILLLPYLQSLHLSQSYRSCHQRKKRKSPWEPEGRCESSSNSSWWMEVDGPPVSINDNRWLSLFMTSNKTVRHKSRKFSAMVLQTRWLHGHLRILVQDTENLLTCFLSFKLFELGLKILIAFMINNLIISQLIIWSNIRIQILKLVLSRRTNLIINRLMFQLYLWQNKTNVGNWVVHISI